jgi:hypothetical protein
MLTAMNIHKPVTEAANAAQAMPCSQLDSGRRFGYTNALVRRCVR